MALRVGIVGFEPGTHWTAYVDAAQQSTEIVLGAVALRARPGEHHARTDFHLGCAGV